MAHELPQMLVLPLVRPWGRWWVVGLINWESIPVDRTVSLAALGLPRGAYHVYDYWRQRYWGVSEGQLAFSLRAYETRLLGLRPINNRPDLVTSTFHVTQGGVEIAGLNWHISDGLGRLTAILRKPGRQFGRLVFSVPHPWMLAQATLDGGRRRPKQLADGVWALGFTMTETATVVLECVRQD